MSLNRVVICHLILPWKVDKHNVNLQTKTKEIKHLDKLNMKIMMSKIISLVYAIESLLSYNW
jgi:hypothetical protein